MDTVVLRNEDGAVVAVTLSSGRVDVWEYSADCRPVLAYGYILPAVANSGRAAWDKRAGILRRYYACGYEPMA